jgi:hypothetical protein
MKLSPFEKIIRLLECWNSDELKQLQSWLSVRIEQLESLAQEFELPPVKSGRIALSVRRFNSIVYRLEKVRCGKENCHRCPHGPYWYGYQRSHGKVVSFYVGKELPSNLM